jgi:hypothetical protein
MFNMEGKNLPLVMRSLNHHKSQGRLKDPNADSSSQPPTHWRVGLYRSPGGSPRRRIDGLELSPVRGVG